MVIIFSSSLLFFHPLIYICSIFILLVTPCYHACLSNVNVKRGCDCTCNVLGSVKILELRYPQTVIVRVKGRSTYRKTGEVKLRFKRCTFVSNTE